MAPTCFRTDEGDPDISIPHHPSISAPSHWSTSNPASSFLDTRYGPWANAMMERQTMKSLEDKFKEQAGGGGATAAEEAGTMTGMAETAGETGETGRGRGERGKLQSD
ncbi:hypothetical protein CLOM_g4088 [Closterium sp. NIES-68]|nr:hypothetical protein CLOM_g4088 [Closterium sp. NIES-68]